MPVSSTDKRGGSCHINDQIFFLTWRKSDWVEDQALGQWMMLPGLWTEMSRHTIEVFRNLLCHCFSEN